MPTNQIFDVAIGEADGNGGDVKVEGNDLALVYKHENQVYLALFGGNVEQDSTTNSPGNNRDWWGNKLLLEPIRQFNSKTERTLNTTSLSSSGRIRIENAVKDDLKYLDEFGAEVEVNVTLPGIDTVKINIKIVYQDGSGSLTIIDFRRRLGDGDFSLFDFNEDFF